MDSVHTVCTEENFDFGQLNFYHTELQVTAISGCGYKNWNFGDFVMKQI